MTNLIQDELVKKGLVDTGKLKRSIKTEVKFTNKGKLDINVAGEDYFKFLDNKFDIVKDAMNSSSFKKVSESIEELYVEFLEQQLDN